MDSVKEEPDQLTLFDLGVDMGRLKREQAKLLEHHSAANTKAAYGCAWKRFREWCAASGREALPATEDTVALYLTHLLQERGARIGTATVHKSAIRSMHQAAGLDLKTNGGVSALLRGARRSRAGVERPGGKAAATVDVVRRMVETIEGTDAQAHRDRAIVAVGFASGMRRSELMGLDLADVEFKPEGLLLTVGRSKTDQTGKGRQVGLMKHKAKAADICPVRLLQRWLKERGDAPGALFGSMQSGHEGERVASRLVAKIVQRAADACGLDARAYGAHSLRAGLVTSCIAAGSSELAIMQRTGHKSVATLQRYVRPASAFAVDPLAKAL